MNELHDMTFLNYDIYHYTHHLAGFTAPFLFFIFNLFIIQKHYSAFICINVLDLHSCFYVPNIINKRKEQNTTNEADIMQQCNHATDATMIN